ncbi:hypothetical protein CLOM_g18117 [Closterium sp. NIES-68]|nr:hypothetical protein CLOM_g18117 [Closterium sp. NIES-68]GJP68258.1 hypothetical protein CLOP_g24982 [Closterium sp. NIES-67]
MRSMVGDVGPGGRVAAGGVAAVAGVAVVAEVVEGTVMQTRGPGMVPRSSSLISSSLSSSSRCSLLDENHVPYSPG